MIWLYSFYRFSLIVLSSQYQTGLLSNSTLSILYGLPSLYLQILLCCAYKLVPSIHKPYDQVYYTDSPTS